MRKYLNQNWKLTGAVLIAASVILVALDLWLKHWAQHNLTRMSREVVIPHVIGLTYLQNSGIAFGMFTDLAWGQWIFSAFKLILIIVLLIFYFRLPDDKKYWLLRAPVILIIAGGIGNLIDRVALGFVRDMIMFLFIDFPIWNLADAYVTVGVFFMLFILLFVVKDLPV